MPPVPTLLDADGIEAARGNPAYSALWLFVELCPEAECHAGHWMLKVVTHGQESLYTIVGHRGDYALRIVNGIAPGRLDHGLLLPVGAVDADGLRVLLASTPVRGTDENFNSQHWVFDVLTRLLPSDAPYHCRVHLDHTFIECLAYRAWVWASEN